MASRNLGYLPLNYKGGSNIVSDVLRALLICAAGAAGSSLCFADGVCKDDNIPIDFVAVGEFTSPQCPGYTNNPFTKNAWEVAKASEGVVVCELPGYGQIGAIAASLIACGGVESGNCPARLDGLPNAFYLRSPSACLK